MIPYQSNRLTAVPRTLEGRLEIMKAIRNLLAQDSVQKFDPDQPRVSAGNPDGGQWTSGSGSDASHTGDSTVILAARRPQMEAACDAQYERDKIICNLVRTPLCWAQAMERYSACLSGRQLPPLNF
jgi:hypothetical protein